MLCLDRKRFDLSHGCRESFRRLSGGLSRRASDKVIESLQSLNSVLIKWLLTGWAEITINKCLILRLDPRFGRKAPGKLVHQLPRAGTGAG